MIRVAIQRLKKARRQGPPAELFQAGGDELVKSRTVQCPLNNYAQRREADRDRRKPLGCIVIYHVVSDGRHVANKYRSKNDAQKLFKNDKRPTEGFKTERGNLVIDAQRVLRLRRHPYSMLLRGDGDMPPPSHNVIRVAIQRLKKATLHGPPAELFQAVTDELVRSIRRIGSR